MLQKGSNADNNDHCSLNHNTQTSYQTH